jgi:arginyl-tRNA synthetase
MEVARSLKKALKSALSGLGIETEPALEHPSELENGDYASGAALQHAKQAGKKPRGLAEEIVAKLGTIEGVAKIEVAGAGFINFFLEPRVFAGDIDAARKKDWGKNVSNKGKRVMVEYTDPNPFKEFHIGHLMSNTIGEATARLIEYTGATVKRANYQGDVGPHVAKALWGIKKLELDASDAHALGKAYTAGATAYEESPEVRKEIDAINALVYDRSDDEINKLYDAGRKASLAHFEGIYQTLGTKFDHYFFESDAAPRGLEIVRAHSDVFVQSEGAIVYHGPHTRVFITSKGLPTYEAKELGLAKMKMEKWPFDTSISVTAHEQSGYFEVVLDAMKRVMPELAPKLKHISHGMMRLSSGKMSSRKGEVITGESLLEDLKEAAHGRAKESRAEDPEKLAEAVAVGAIKYQILKQASGRDIIFERERALSLEGDSGPYLQYAHARAHAVVEKAKEQKVKAKVDKNAEPTELSRLLHRFPEAVEYAARELEPHLLTNYLLEFAGAFNRWYANEQILDGSTSSPHKVALTDAARQTLKNALFLLGIPAPEKM